MSQSIALAPEISGTSDIDIEPAVVGGHRALVLDLFEAIPTVEYTVAAFDGASYRVLASEKPGPLAVLALLARVRERLMSSEPDDPAEMWERSALVASMTVRQWQAIGNVEESGD